MGSRKKPTRKQKRFVQGVVAGKSDKRAAIDAGYTVSMAENTKARIWSKPEVQEYFRDLMRSAAPPERIVKRISEHIDGKSISTRIRKRTVPSSDPAKRGEEITETTVERTESIDASVSLRAIEMAIEACEYVPRRAELALDVGVGVTLEQAIVESGQSWEPPEWAVRAKARA